MKLQFLFVGVLAAVSACGGGGGDGGTQPTPTVATLTVTPTGPTLDTLYARGETVQLNVVARDADNNVISAPTLTFSTSAGTVASVSNTGLITAEGNGAAIITVASGNVSAQRTVPVRQRLTSVTLDPSPVVMVVGTSRPVTATGRDSRGNAIPGLAAASFTSNNELVVTTTTDGTLSAVAVGTTSVSATITAVDGPVTGNANVQVLLTFPLQATITLEGSSFAPSEVTIGLGGVVTFQNTSGELHNVTFGAGGPEGIPNHSTGSFQRTFNNAGTFNFQCTLHDGMTGRVIVQ